jgi:hypothetical protein
MKSKKRLMVLGASLLLLMGCATASMHGRYGAIVLSAEAGRQFEAYRMDPNVNYYYSGPDAAPNALMGLDKAYVLDNDLWKAVAPNPKVFKELIVGMQDRARNYGWSQYGFVIQDPFGKPIGVWYSILSLKTLTVLMGEGNKVVIYTPELNIFPGEFGDRPAGRR